MTMTIQQAISKCNKKAWEDIRALKTANNMLEVEQSLSNAIEKTFGLWNQGLLLVRMKKLGQMGELEGSQLIRIRRHNFMNHASIVRDYLIGMIPHRFYKTMMYKNLL